MTPKQAAQIRGAVIAVRGTQVARDAWALDNERRTPLELTALMEAHRRLVWNHYRREAQKRNSTA